MPANLTGDCERTVGNPEPWTDWGAANPMTISFRTHRDHFGLKIRTHGLSSATLPCGAIEIESHTLLTFLRRYQQLERLQLSITIVSTMQGKTRSARRDIHHPSRNDHPTVLTKTSPSIYTKSAAKRKQRVVKLVHTDMDRGHENKS